MNDQRQGGEEPDHAERAIAWRQKGERRWVGRPCRPYSCPASRGCGAALYRDTERLVALRWLHHRAYDTGRLERLPHLEPRWRVEIAHAVLHLGLVSAMRRLGRRQA